jgi:hypothetical protein
MSRYSPTEDAILRPYVYRPVMCWRAVLMNLPGRSHTSAEKRLTRLRRKAGTLWTIPGGGQREERIAA